MNVEEYYKSVDFQIVWDKLGDWLKFRQIRLLTENGFVKVKKTVRTAKDLKEIMMKYKPIKAFYTVAKFLNASRIGPRKVKNGYQLASNLFLTQDKFVFDLDVNVKENLEKLLQFCEEYNYKIEYMIKSGHGVHLSIFRPLECNIADPRQREKWFIEQNKKLIKQVQDYGVEIDSCIQNSRQIVKIPMSLSDGISCSFIHDARELPISARKNELNSLNKECMVEEPRNSHSSINPINISSSVLGTKLHVPILSFYLNQLDETKEKIKRLIKKHNLTDCYILGDTNHLYMICLKPLQEKKLVKLLNYSNFKFFKRYHYLFLGIDGLKYLTTIPGDNNQVISQAHYLYLLALGIPMKKYKKFTRKNKLKVMNFAS